MKMHRDLPNKKYLSIPKTVSNIPEVDILHNQLMQESIVFVEQSTAIEGQFGVVADLLPQVPQQCHPIQVPSQPVLKQGFPYSEQMHELIVFGSFAEACQPLHHQAHPRVVLPGWTPPRAEAEALSTPTCQTGCCRKPWGSNWGRRACC
eukprot:TRINITY_DN5501_c1_g1_i1.p1 TRINITY_DN5501_c1_g1~~TRINITY_DN5501_c1_g1_i1.p1  ORF type:complete len:149 (-),score=15.46 TRINITY_DN5501_c1_g1_i1:61-507(-)